MRHDDLLATIAVDGGSDKLKRALLAVVKLHKPDEDNEYCDYDSPEWDVVPYPCATIQAIEKELA